VSANADGHFRAQWKLPAQLPSLVSVAERENLVYIVQTDDGQYTLTPDEFAQRFGWKNDPSKVTLTPAE